MVIVAIKVNIKKTLSAGMSHDIRTKKEDHSVQNDYMYTWYTVRLCVFN